MEKKYLNESRYKKGINRKRRDASTVKSNLNAKPQVKKNKTQNQIKVKNVKVKSKKIKTKKNTSNPNKLANIVICIILLIVIAIISRAITKEDGEPFIPMPFFEQSNDEVIKVGVVTEEDLLNINSKNSVIHELYKYAKDMLLEIEEDYSISYRCISSVTKVSNTEYILNRNVKSNVNIESIKQAISKYMTDKQGVYYSKLENISNIEIIDGNTLHIKLKKDMPYFIYNLEICLNSSNDVTNYVIDNLSTSNKLIMTRHKQADKNLPAKIIVTKYKSIYTLVQAYKEDEINLFVTDAENVENLLGKYEYNIKQYRNGQSLMLFINHNSDLCSRLEVRKAIAYGIDRDSLIHQVLKGKGVKIDLPYIYDDIKYKYDVYAAENLLLTSGYKKNNKVYYKTENGKKKVLELNLIVNKNDEEKVNIANEIKNNLSAIGIKINVEQLNVTKLQERIKQGTYDLVLANIDLNNIPDVSFIKNHLFMTDNIKKLLETVNESTIQELNQNITLLKNTLSEEVSVIGIYSNVSYLVYNKNIIGIDDISYLNIFKDILK